MTDKPSPAAPKVSCFRMSCRTCAKLILALLITLVVLEVGLRIVGVRPISVTPETRDPQELHPDPLLAHAQREGWIPWPHETVRVPDVPEHSRGFIDLHYNNCGFREEEDTELEPADGVLRILVTGDSHTDGICFNDESYANLLEASRNRVDESPHCEVINAGFGRSSPYQQLWAYEQVFRRFKPRHVIVGFYAGNDLLELLRRDDRVHLEWNGQQFVPTEPTNAVDATRTSHAGWERLRGALRDHLALYHALTKVSSLRRLVRSAANDEYRERLEQATSQNAAPVWQGLNQAYYFRHHPEHWDDASRMMRYVLARFRDLTRRDGAALTVVILPTLRQIHPQTDADVFAATATTLALDDEDQRCDERACDLIAALTADLDIPTLDLRTPFRAALRDAPNRRLFYRFDHHLNVAGHRLTAELLEKFLTEEVSPNRAE